MKTASWVVRRLENGEVLFETFNPRILDVLNTDKYEAVPIMDYLIGLNRKIKSGSVGYTGSYTVETDERSKK